MRYLVDSDWLIDATGGKPAAADFLAQLSVGGLAVSIIAVAEIYEGAFGISHSDAIVVRFARLRAALRRQGQLIPDPDMDLLIAATALVEGLTLVTRNTRHFERIGELNIYSPD